MIDDQSTFLEERQPVILQSETPIDDLSLQPRYPVIVSPTDGTEGQRSTEVKDRSGATNTRGSECQSPPLPNIDCLPLIIVSISSGEGRSKVI